MLVVWGGYAVWTIVADKNGKKTKVVKSK